MFSEIEYNLSENKFNRYFYTVVLGKNNNKFMKNCFSEKLGLSKRKPLNFSSPVEIFYHEWNPASN